MRNNPNSLANLKPFQPGQSGNPAGAKPGSRHISYWIQKGLESEMEFEDIKGHKYKGMPIEAIVQVAIKRSREGDQKWADWLAKYGYAQKVQLGNDPENPLTDVNHMSKEQLEDAIRAIVGGAATSSGAVHPSAEPSQG
jgi:hypothetical protein